MKNTFIIFFLSLTFSAYSQQGTYQFLKNDVSARSAALNSSFVSMKDDPNGLFYNPALIGTLTIPRISANYLKYLMDVNAGALSYGQYIEGIGYIGSGVTYIDYGSFTRRDWTMSDIGTFGVTELAVTAGIATYYDDDILIGLSAKYIYSSIAEYISSAYAFDFGLLYEIKEQNLTIGASVLNVGNQIKTYTGFTELLPLDVKVGITKRPEHLPVYLNFTFHRMNEKQTNFFSRFSNFTFGAEFLMSSSLRLRIGYNNKQRKEFKMGTSAGLGGFSFGGGLVFNDYLIDYAYKSYNKIGGPHWFSIGINL